jgi:pimeloyl-ACP methyl ester carboxylesterase
MNRKGALALAGSAAGIGAGLIAQRSVVQRRRRTDPEAGEAFGTRRGERSRNLALDDGANLFIEETGPESSRGVVFIHGSCLRTDTWHYQMPGLGGHRLVFYDLRGHGLSQPKGDSEYTIRTLAGDLAKVIDSSELEEVVLVGHSVGGMIALELCSHLKEQSETVKGLIVLNTTYRPAAETLLGGSLAKIERVTRRPFDFLGSRAKYIQTLRTIIKPSDSIFMAVSLAGFGPSASASQIDFTYDMLAETPADVIFDLIKSYRDFDVRDVMHEIEVPTLVVGGTHDRLTSPDASEFLAQNIPDAKLKMFDRCGHMSMLERHRDLNRLLEDFFFSTLGAPDAAGSRTG